MIGENIGTRGGGCHGLEHNVFHRDGLRRGRLRRFDFVGEFQHVILLHRGGRQPGGLRLGGRSFRGILRDDLADGGENFLHGGFVLRVRHWAAPQLRLKIGGIGQTLGQCRGDDKNCVNAHAHPAFADPMVS